MDKENNCNRTEKKSLSSLPLQSDSQTTAQTIKPFKKSMCTGKKKITPPSFLTKLRTTWKTQKMNDAKHACSV